MPDDTAQAASGNARAVGRGKPDMLAALAKHPDGHVRQNLVTNQNITPDVLAVLATDSIPDVRQAVAQHPRTPQHVIDAMASSTDPSVQRGLARRNSMTV